LPFRCKLRDNVRALFPVSCCVRFALSLFSCVLIDFAVSPLILDRQTQFFSPLSSFAPTLSIFFFPILLRYHLDLKLPRDAHGRLAFSCDFHWRRTSASQFSRLRCCSHIYIFCHKQHNLVFRALAGFCPKYTSVLLLSFPKFHDLLLPVPVIQPFNFPLGGSGKPDHHQRIPRLNSLPQPLLEFSRILLS